VLGKVDETLDDFCISLSSRAISGLQYTSQGCHCNCGSGGSVKKCSIIELTEFLFYVPDQLVFGNVDAFERSGLTGLQLLEDMLDHEALLHFLFVGPHGHCLWIVSYFIFVQDIGLRRFI